MDLVVDIQGFTDYDGSFIPKEVAAITTGYDFLGHWIVKPPRHFWNLSDEYKKRNNWVTVNRHGLEWHEGETSMNSLHHYIRTIAAPCENIYTRGREKALYLQTITAREVVDLSRNRCCPSFNKIDGAEKTVCHLHMMKHRPNNKSTPYICALNNVYKLRTVLTDGTLDNETYDTVDTV